MSTLTCEKTIQSEFTNTIQCGMATAENLKSKSVFDKFKLSTIKGTLSRLKKAKFLVIAFRTNGCMAIGGYRKGKCYYKVK